MEIILWKRSSFRNLIYGSAVREKVFKGGRYEGRGNLIEEVGGLKGGNSE